MTVTEHCINGHEWTPENTSLDKRGARSCRACARERYWSRGKAARDMKAGGAGAARRAANAPLVAAFRAMNDAGVLDDYLMQRLAGRG